MNDRTSARIEPERIKTGQRKLSLQHLVANKGRTVEASPASRLSQPDGAWTLHAAFHGTVAPRIPALKHACHAKSDVVVAIVALVPVAVGRAQAFRSVVSRPAPDLDGFFHEAAVPQFGAAVQCQSFQEQQRMMMARLPAGADAPGAERREPRAEIRPASPQEQPHVAGDQGQPSKLLAPTPSGPRVARAALERPRRDGGQRRPFAAAVIGRMPDGLADASTARRDSGARP